MPRPTRLMKLFAFALFFAATAVAQPPDQDLLQAREKVWRAWFNGDAATLKAMVPPETIVMSVDDKNWRHQQDVLAASAKFHAEGGKLVRLEFPRTEVQHYGDVAIIWSSSRNIARFCGLSGILQGLPSERVRLKTTSTPPMA